MANVAFLGTGLIGAGMIEAQRRRGHQVSVWNRTATKARALESFGVRVATAADEAVRGAERVHLALTDDAAVDAVLALCAPAIDAATIVVDHTTASPQRTAERFARCDRDGLAYLHAPVFMSPQACRDARGMMLCAGPRDRFALVTAALEEMTGEVWYVGERTDLAASYKLFGNAMLIAITAGLADVFALARSLAIAPADAHALFSRFNPAGVIGLRGAKMVAGEFEASFEMTMARKDLRLMLEVASAGGQQLAALPAIAQRMDALIAKGHGGDDMAALAIEAISGASSRGGS